MKLPPRWLLAFGLVFGAMLVVGLALLAHEMDAPRLGFALQLVAAPLVVAGAIAVLVLIVAPGRIPDGDEIDAARKQGLLAILKVMAGDKPDR